MTTLHTLGSMSSMLVGPSSSNLIAPGSGESLKIYVMKGEAGNVYTLATGQSVQIEDGHTTKMITIEAYWIRWTAADSNGT